MVSFIIIQFIYVIYQQTSITVQYKNNLNYMFKDILYPSVHSIQNQTIDRCIIYLTRYSCFYIMTNTRLLT